MTSLTATPMQLLLISCEVICALENRLSLQKEWCNVPGLKCDVVMEEILHGIISKIKPEEMFCPRRVLSGEEVVQFFQVIEHGSLSFKRDGPAKLICIASTAVRVQLIRLDQASDMTEMLEEKMGTLMELFPNARTREAIRRMENAGDVFYAGLCEGEMNRIRTTIINSLRSVNTTVETLIQGGMQSASGRAVCKRHGASVARLGFCRRLVDGLESSIESRFAMAEQREAVEEGERIRGMGRMGNM